MTGRRRVLLPGALALAAALLGACASGKTRSVTPPPQRQQAPTPAVAAPDAPPPAPAAAPQVAAPPATTPSGAPAPRESGETAQAPTPRVPGAAPAAPAAARGRQIVLNFDNADIEAVIQAASEITGFSYTIGPGVAGKKVTVQTAGRIPEDEVFNVLLAVLEVNGVTAIKSGNLYKVIPLAAARERSIPTIIGAQADPSRRGDEVVTQIVPIANGQTERIAAAIRPFIQGGNLVVHGNLLLITDNAANVGRLLQIVAVLDVETTQDELRILPVRYADAIEIAKTLSDFFSGRRVRTSGPAAPAPAPAPTFPRPGAPPVPGAPAGTDPGERPPLILADKRTNALIISARRADHDIITQLLTQLDVDTQANKRVFVFYVENVKAKELATTLGEIFGKAGESKPERREGGVEVPGAPPRQPPTPFAPTAAPLAAQPGAELEASVVEGTVKVIADEPNNALIITTFPRNWPLIEDTIRKLDRTPKQVLIEVLVAEITLDDESAYGMAWTLRSQGPVKVGGQPYNVGGVGRLDVGPPAPPLTNPTLPGLPVLVPPVSGLSFFIFETDRFLGLLNLYASYGKLNVLSSPHVLTSENKKASINVSNSIPIVTGQSVAQTGTVATTPQQVPSSVLNQTVEYRDAGIILTVTPRISDKRVVALEVKQTVNDVGPAQPPSGSPIIIKREAETSVVLHDNQTLILGGLITTTRRSTRTGIPGLARIPIIGFLFGSTNDEFQRTELLIVITPRVIGDPTEAREILDQMRAQRPELQRGLRAHPSILKPERIEPDGSSRRDTQRDTSMAEPAAPIPPVPGDPSER
jgi:general secretion pathway protein D